MNWINLIQTALYEGKSVIADATHINAISRTKTMRALDLDDIEVISVVFTTDKEECLERNSKREGRARVPDRVINDMFERFQMPDCDRENIDKIWRI